MKIHELVDGVQTKADLVRFIRDLAQDLEARPAEWENHNLERYLAALARWLEDCDGYYQNQARDVPAAPSWKNVAEMLIAAKTYE